MKKPTLSLRPMVAFTVTALATLGGTQAFASDENTPLSLTISHDIKRDSNFSRNEEKLAETINTTALKVGFDKAYGRQVLSASAQVSAVRYANRGETLNNEGKDLRGSLSSGIASNWSVTGSGNYSEYQNPTQNNLIGSRVVRNIRKYGDVNLAVQYGNGGTWALVGTQDLNKLRFSNSAYSYQNANQRSTGLKVLYYSTDLLYYGLGGRLVTTQYPTNRDNEEITDKNIDFSVNWQATGVSGLQAVLSRRNSSYANDDDRDVRGWTGSLNWNYTPRGLLSYGLAISRATGADRTSTNFVSQSGQSLATLSYDYNTVTTSYGLSANLRATGKLSFGLSHSIAQYQVDNKQVASRNVLGLVSSSSATDSTYQSTTLSGTYDVLRGLRLGCSVQRYSQTPDQSRPKYDGQAYDCYASMTFD